MKTQILAAIGETVLQPAARLNAALAANDRIKYAFSLLQLALSYADHPEQAAATMKQERIACGINDPDLDTAVAGARMNGKLCHVPGAARIMCAHYRRCSLDGGTCARHESGRDGRAARSAAKSATCGEQ